MHLPLAFHARRHAGFPQQIHSALFQNAGAYAAKDIVWRLCFEDHGFNTLQMQQVPEQQAGRTGANDGDLRFHFVSFGWLANAASAIIALAE
jgi:hypothetical protein